MISIVMPTWNRFAFLCDTLDSIHAQSFKDWELIVADDGSGSEMRSALESLDRRDARIRVLSLAHSGNPPAVRNAALAVAQGELVAFIDSDDLWLPEKLERQVAALQENPTALWSFSGFSLIDAAGLPLQRAGAPVILAADSHASRSALLAALLGGTALVTQSSVVMKRWFLESLKGYDPRFPICGDYELWLRAARRGNAAIVSEPLVQVRRHDDHYSGDIPACQDFLGVLNETSRQGVPRALHGLLRKRRAHAASTLAQSCARSGARRLLVRTLLTTASFGWRDRTWWLGVMIACAHLCTTHGMRRAVRRALRRSAT